MKDFRVVRKGDDMTAPRVFWRGEGEKKKDALKLEQRAFVVA